MVQKSSHPMLHYRQADAEYSHIFGVHGTTRRYLLCKSPVTAVHTVHCTCHYPPPSHLPHQLHICICQAVYTYNLHTGIDGSENALPWTHSMHDAVQNFRTLEIVWQVWLDNYICFVEIFVYIPPVQYKLTCLAHSWTSIFSDVGFEPGTTIVSASLAKIVTSLPPHLFVNIGQKIDFGGVKDDKPVWKIILISQRNLKIKIPKCWLSEHRVITMFEIFPNPLFKL